MFPEQQKWMQAKVKGFPVEMPGTCRWPTNFDCANFKSNMSGNCKTHMQHGEFTVSSGCCGSDAMIVFVMDRSCSNGGFANIGAPVLVTGGFSFHCHGGTNDGRHHGSSNPGQVNCCQAVPDNGDLNKEAVKHDLTACCLAAHPCVSVNHKTKLCVHKDAVVLICDGGEMNWLVKTLFLTQHFQFPVFIELTKEEVAMVKDKTGACFVCTLWGLLDDNFGVVVVGVGPCVPNNSCFVCFDVTINTSPVMDTINTVHKPEVTTCLNALVHPHLDVAIGNLLGAYTVANMNAIAGKKVFMPWLPFPL